jgi:septal ring factor EnvC (AmiA/AmiB activator)
VADRRFEEMLDRMQAAVEDVAQLYGNPTFLQVFTNDAARATELKQRLKAAQTDEDVAKELAVLEKKRDDLRGDIALKEREASRLTTKLVHQRAALDSLAAAVDQARKVIEDTAK